MINETKPDDAAFSPELGLTKREYFAAQIFAGMLAGASRGEGATAPTAHSAVAHADTLINALNSEEEKVGGHEGGHMSLDIEEQSESLS